MLAALRQGKHVVSANKAALAERWAEFKPYLGDGLLHFEAAVMAGTPVIGPLTQCLRGSKPLELHAILNGTCNYMLSALEQGTSYQSALAEAQRLGYAEADPSLDVGGFDAAHKLTLLARLAFDPEISWQSVKATTRGIEQLTPEQMKAAIDRGGCIRLLASVYPEQAAWQVKVRPVWLAAHHPMAHIASHYNALYFKGDAVGEILITGAGAGGMATASGVLSDVIEAVQGRPGPSLLSQARPVPQDLTIEVLEEIA
jgi:homoserine dehydrogenase